MFLRRSLTRTAAVCGAVAFSLAGLTTAAAAATPTAPSVGVAPAPSVVRDGLWLIATDSTGATLSWSGATPPLDGNARPEFALDGRRLGAARLSDDGTRLQMVVPGLSAVSASRLSVLLGGRRIDAPAPRARTFRQAQTAALSQPSTIVRPDPGVPGSFATRSFNYTMPTITVPDMPVPLEVVGHVVAPVGITDTRPVVVFLHGRHSTCYSGTETSIDWPCADGYQPIPSLDGYEYAQQLLASRGVITVSIAANGINGQDGNVADSGANARSVLLRHHLDLLAGWNTTAGPGDVATLLGHLDLRRVMLVGHSRGGEGAARASIDARSSDPYRVVGQVLIAPTDFGRQVASGVPTTVLLPYCDGDVSDLQGQQFVDQARGLVDGDNSLVTAAMVLGANHNYFNSEWTPGDAAAPSNDDWGDAGDPTCGTSSPSRLDAKAQRAVGATYISAAAETYLRRSSTAIRLLDGGQVRAQSAGKAVVLTEALGGKRIGVLTDPARATLTSGANSTSTACAGFSNDPSTNCFGFFGVSSPHWLPGEVPTTVAWSGAWSAAGETVSARLPAPVNVAAATNLDLRIAADPSVAESTFRVVLTDASGKSAQAPVDSRLRPLPGSGWSLKVWAQTVRVQLSGVTGIDLTAVQSISLRGVSAAGKVYVLDAYASTPGRASTSIQPWSVPHFDARTTAVTVPGDDATHTANVTIAVSGNVGANVRLWVALDSYGGKPPGPINSFPGGIVPPLPSGVTEVSVPVGAKSLTVPVTVVGSSLYSPTPDVVSVRIYASHNAVVSNYIGGVAVTTNVPAPTLSAVKSKVWIRQGEAIVWILKLSAPTRFGLYGTALAVAPTSGTELTTAGLLAPWAAEHSGSLTLPDGSPAPLSKAPVTVWFGIDRYATTAIIEIPTARTSTVTRDRQVSLEIAPDGGVITAPLRLNAVVRPAL